MSAAVRAGRYVQVSVSVSWNAAAAVMLQTLCLLDLHTVRSPLMMFLFSQGWELAEYFRKPGTIAESPRWQRPQVLKQS